jgi:hypothetical protein
MNSASVNECQDESPVLWCARELGSIYAVRLIGGSTEQSNAEQSRLQ